MSTDITRHRAGSPIGRLARQRWVPFAAAATAAALTVGAIATTGGGAAGAATAPQAQSAGNFVDATLGGKPIDQIAALKYARAQAPGANGVQNPLDVTVLNAINLPLTGALQLPTLLGINLGAANQVAKANVDGSSYGAAGAVNNSGGVSVGGDNNAFPSNATINLSGSGIAGSAGAAGDALGGVKVNLGAVSAIAQTPVGYAKAGTTQYKIADLNLELGSPLLAQTLAPVLSGVTGVLKQVATAAGAVTQKISGCDLTSGAVPTTLSLEGGAVVIDPATGKITIDLDALLKVLKLDLNNLPPNTDLVNLLVNYLTSPDGLAAAIQGAVDGLVNPLITKYEACRAAVAAIPVLGPVLQTLLDTLVSGKATLEATLSGLAKQFGAAAGTNPLAPLADVLKKIVDIGVNVQPLVKSGDFTDKLADHTPKQNETPPPAVPYSTLVRAIEVNVLPTNNTDGLLSLALANAAAGPSTAPAAPPSTSPAPPTTAPPTRVPTGVPAGAGTHGASPVLPLTLLLLGLMFAGGGAFAYRYRGTLKQH